MADDGLDEARAQIANQTANALGNHAKSVAMDTFRRKVRDTLKPYLPRFLHPLLPGMSGSVKERIQDNIWRWISGLIVSAIFFAVAIFLAGVAVVAVGGIVVWAVMQGPGFR